MKGREAGGLETKCGFLAGLGLLAALVACGCGGSSPINDGGSHDGDAPADAADASPADDSRDAGDAPAAEVNSDAEPVAGADAADAALDAPIDTGGLPGDAALTDGNSGGDGGGGEALSLFIPVDKVVANGWSMIPVAVRTGGGQTPPAAELTFSLSRADAGILRPRIVAAGTPEPQLYFTPCDGAATASCLGPVTIRVARSSAPDTVLAESRVLTLTNDPDVGSPAACLLGGNTLFLDGTADGVLFGVSLVRDGTFDPTGAARQRIKIGVNPKDVTKPTYGAYWNIDVSSTATMTDLTKGIYRKSAGAAQTLTITRANTSTGACSAGAFQILDLVWAGNQLETFMATFDLACSYVGTALRGCVRFSAQ